MASACWLLLDLTRLCSELWLLLLKACQAHHQHGPQYSRAIRRGPCWGVEDHVSPAHPEDQYEVIRDNLDLRPGV